MTAQKYTARNLSPHGGHCRSQSLLITLRAATRWRPVRPQLAEGEITAKDSHARGAECIRQCDEKWSVAIRSRAVRQDEAITASMSWEVQVPSNGYFIRWSVKKLSTVHIYKLCSQPAGSPSLSYRSPANLVRWGALFEQSSNRVGDAGLQPAFVGPIRNGL